MADNFLQFSLAVPLKTKAELLWCTKTMVAFNKLLDGDVNETEDPEQAHTKLAAELGDLGQRVLDEDWDYRGFEWSIEPANSGKPNQAAELWLCSEDSGNPDQVAAFLQAYLQRFHPQGSLWFSWSYTCSKMRVNEFGGGAAVVRASDTDFLDVQQWAQAQGAKVPKNRRRKTA